MQIDELAKIIRECGVVGSGGAGFPSYAKLNEKTDTIILNCAECEPLLKLHRQVLQKYAYEILHKSRQRQVTALLLIEFPYQIANTLKVIVLLQYCAELRYL